MPESRQPRDGICLDYPFCAIQVPCGNLIKDDMVAACCLSVAAIIRLDGCLLIAIAAQAYLAIAQELF